MPTEGVRDVTGLTSAEVQACWGWKTMLVPEANPPHSSAYPSEVMMSRCQELGNLPITLG
jgi:hypothetical protein